MNGLRRGVALAVAVLAAATLGVSGCGSGDDAAGGEAIAIGATLGGDAGEYAITLDASSAAAGAVTFEITNKGELEHEFEVIRTDVAADAFEVADGKAVIEEAGGEAEEAADGEAAEEEGEELEVEDIEPGDTVTLEAELEAGRYAIICNLPGHYEDGMRTGFTVD